MAVERDPWRDWHRLFGLLLIDFFTDSPFAVEVERDLSVQQQLLDVVIVRRRRGRFAERLPDGLHDLAAHNLITFKSHHEALTDWATKELLSHYVAYRKLVSVSPTALLPEGQFHLYAVCARFPHNLAGQVPWQERQAGVYHCQWGTDVVRVIVTGQLPREVHNAPLHLFSASRGLVDFGSQAYQQRSADTSSVLGQLIKRFRAEGLTMTYTMEDFRRDYAKEYFPKLTPQEQRQVLEALPPDVRRQVLEALPPQERMAGLRPEERMAGLTAEQLQQYLDQLTAGRPTAPRKPRRKK